MAAAEKIVHIITHSLLLMPILDTKPCKTAARIKASSSQSVAVTDPGIFQMTIFQRSTPFQHICTANKSFCTALIVTSCQTPERLQGHLMPPRIVSFIL